MAEQFEMIKQMVKWEGFDKDRVEDGVKKLLVRVDTVMLHFMENCVSCSLCKTACPYYYVDERYSPVNKAEEARKIYRKELTIAGKILGPLVHASKPGSEADLDRIVELAYACTNCGACYTACPFGIDSGSIISAIRSMLTAAGRTPTILAAFKATELNDMYLNMPGLMQAWEEAMKKAEEAIGKPLPYDKEGAEILFFPTLIDALFLPDAVAGSIKILDRLGVDWTLPSKPVGIRPPIGLVSGDLDSAKAEMRKVYQYLKSMRPKIVVVMDGGFVYPAFRWKMPTMVGEKPPFKVLHITELLYDAIKKGKLKLRQTDDPVTWHSPCQLGRRGGVIEEPEAVLRAASKGFRPLPHHGINTLCCGGGGGMGCMTMQMHDYMSKLTGISITQMMSEKERKFLEKVEQNYRIAVRRKMEDVAKSGAKTVVSACPVCIHTIEMGSQLYGPEVKVVHISEYIAERLE